MSAEWCVGRDRSCVEFNLQRMTTAFQTEVRAPVNLIILDGTTLKGWLSEPFSQEKDPTVGVSFNLERMQENFSECARRRPALTSLSFTNRKGTNTGFMRWLDLGMRKRIHNLAHAYAIDQESQFQQQGFGNGCGLCRKTHNPSN